MKPLFKIALIFGSSALAFSSFAAESGMPKLGIPKPKSVQPIKEFPDKLESSQFTTSVEGAQNSWRAVLRDADHGVRVGLKVGVWDRPDPETVDTVWVAIRVDWAKIVKRDRELEFTYTYDDSTDGVQSIFKFGASADSVGQVESDCTLTLTYGASDCTFRRGEASTSGQLPFKITTGTTVRIRIKADDTLDIWIDDQPVLADQVVDIEENLVSFIAKTDSPAKPHFLNLSSFKAELVRPE
jgi:hypothetical protein